jgi:Tol biopolymer transport system component
MALETGTRLGPYDIVSKLGAGGMGEVYRARDTRLDRDVALKILPESFAADPDRLMRFKREAKTLASLSHANIAAIFGLEEVPAAASPGGRRPPAHALVMELVEGEDLSARIARGPMPLDEAAPIARQIADALEAAHEAGIIHRDLKPANIKVRADGAVKVLDFGLAKAVGGDAARSGEPDSSFASPTMTSPAMTAMGLILGTAAYMAPEQARGRAVDRRADIWAFGCVLYEMLTGRRAFEGDDVSTTLAGVLKDHVRWDALPPDLPPAIRRLLRRCLEKDPARRLSAIGDARLELDERDAVEPGAAAAGPPAASRRSPALIAAVVAGVAATAALTLWMTASMREAPGALQRVTILAPKGQPLFRDSANLAISPDGQRVAFLTGTSRSDSRLWIRTLADLAPREVEDSTGAQLPFWSPDSQTVAFFARGRLMTAAAAGGRPQALVDAPDGRGGTWSAAGVIVFAASSAGRLSRVSSNGGAVTDVTALDTAKGETGHRFPAFLPDGRHFLFAALPAHAAMLDIFVGDLDSTDRTLLLTAESTPIYAAPGYLIYSRKGVLVAHAFDASTRRLAGEAVPIGDTPGEMNVEYSAGWSASVASDGTLAYLSAAEMRSRLAWLDQSGREVAAVDVPPGPYMSVSLSRDGRRAAVTELAAPEAHVSWVDLVRGGLAPISRLGGWNAYPVWSNDARRVAYESDRAGPIDLYLRAIDGTEDEVLFQSPGLFKHIRSWSPDGQVVVYTDLSPETGDDLWTIRPGSDRKPELFLRTPGADAFGTISPDGRWMAFITDQAGRFDAYVQAFPGPGPAHRITTGGTQDWGIWWRGDSRQLLVLDAELQLLLVDVVTSPDFSADAPRAVGRLRFPVVSSSTVDAAPDLQRLLAIVPEQADGSRSLTVVQNWRKALR